MFHFVGYTQDNNTALALRRTIMVTTVELLQRSVPTKMTKEEFNRQLTEIGVSKEGMLFLSKGFDFYKKEISTKDVLNSYDGDEVRQMVKFITNGGNNVFGNLNELPVQDKKDYPKWLKDILIVLLEVTNIVINTCNALPWPC